jgi:LacI family transcriptional regulator, xylobiose transport system transcriptional regulator
MVLPTEEPRPTLAMLAEDAGVSTSTVSKVLNGRADVGASTRARVEQTLRRHQYRRRGAGANPSTLIELVFHGFTEAWSVEIVNGVQSVAEQAGLSVVLSISGDRHSPGPDWLGGVLRRRPVGVLLVFSNPSAALREQLRSRDIPFVVIDPAGDPPPGVPAVGSANWNGGLVATRHLLELGHRRIAAITGPADMMSSVARLDGFRTAMAAAGVPVEPDWVRYGDFQISGGRDHAKEFFASDHRPTAIFAGSDLQALGVLEAATRADLRVPEDVSVVGYDDLPLAQWFRPRLTTVHQPLRAMAAQATRMVLQLAAGGQVGQQRIDLATDLVVRETTAPPP